MKITLPLRSAFPLAAMLTLLAAASTVRAQVSLATAVDLSIRNSPRVKSAEADVVRTRAALAETKDVFIPTVNAGANFGQAYGYSPYPPTLFTVNAGSLIYNSSQISYIHSAESGLIAAQRSLDDMREVVAEDAALTFIALDRDQQREDVLKQEADYSARLLQIVRDRFDAGQDTNVDLTNTKLAGAQLHLARLRAEDETANDRAHLARLMGVPPGSLRAENGFPAAAVASTDLPSGPYANASVAAAFANAKAKQLQAHGDARFLYRPSISLFTQYNRYATFTNSFKDLQKQYQVINPDGSITNRLGSNETAFGVQVTIPLLDRFKHSKAAETAAEASRALHDAEFAQASALDAQGRLGHSIEELQARTDVAALELQLAQQQLEILQLQLASPNATPQPMTPKEEQNSRIAEREKYLAVVDTAFQLHQAQVSFLRQAGRLQEWLRQTGSTPPLITQPHP